MFVVTILPSWQINKYPREKWPPDTTAIIAGVIKQSEVSLKTTSELFDVAVLYMTSSSNLQSEGVKWVLRKPKGKLQGFTSELLGQPVESWTLCIMGLNTEAWGRELNQGTNEKNRPRRDNDTLYKSDKHMHTHTLNRTRGIQSKQH